MKLHFPKIVTETNRSWPRPQPCFNNRNRMATMSTAGSELSTLNTTDLFIAACKNPSLPSLLPLSLSLVSSNSHLPAVPSDFPHSKIIPKTRFAVDAFRQSGDFSISYFLSHFHSDHYAGLTASWTKGIIFCSETTSRLVVKVLGVSQHFVVQLPLNETVLVDGCEVTLIDANHCPGAVQFLFKIPGNDGKYERYVHTGDFRYCASMKLEPKLSLFIGSNAIFLDTTYCNPKFVFPSQEESIDYVASVIDRIGAENRTATKSVLFLVATYVIGKEKILIEISRKCNCKIYVDSRKRAVLRTLGYGDDRIFTEDELATDVHVVGWNVLGETWPYFRPNFGNLKKIMAERGYSKVVGFVPTGWTYEVKRNKFVVRTKDAFEIHLVPYSEHSNYAELREYVKFLRPKRVIPTVGSDVEDFDSKHATKMRKYFAGLVDEMANKQEFLMGFHRFAQVNCGATSDAAITGSESCLRHIENVEPSRIVTADDIDPEAAVAASASVVEPGSGDATLLDDKEKEDIIQELHESLPTWVTRDQMGELVNTCGRNIVDAVSYFYEHETEFYEQIKASTTSRSGSNSKSDFRSPSNPGSTENSLEAVKLSKNVNHKSPILKPLVGIGSSVSPGKRRRINANKTNKKMKPNSNIESTGSKQASITNFFNKLRPTGSQGGSSKATTATCPDNKVLSPNDSSILYEEEVEQFIQIINGNESSRSQAATIIAQTKGDINLALDIYYSNAQGHVGGDEKGTSNQAKKPLEAEVGHDIPSCSQGRGLEPRTKNHKNLQDQLVENVSATSVSLPPEKYSPIEHACWRYGQPAPYIHVARTFDLVEGEKGKIKATSMLCNMFRSLLALSPEDVLPAVYLCTHKIAPDHENMELNIGGSLVSSALEEACGTNRSKIREMYNNVGDLGDVAQECRQTQSLLVPPPPLLIRDVFSVLQKISIQTGSGSTSRKKSLIVGLMRSCREKEIKFIVRTLVRNLRIGAMMRTVLPALAHAVVMNSLPKSHHEGTVENLKEKLQSLSAAVVEAYHVLPNLDVLVPSLMSKGTKFSSTTLTMVPGVPIKPMLAKITNGVPQAIKDFKNKSFTCEYKYDGQRAQIHKFADGSVHIFSRNGDETTSKFPDVVKIVQESCKSSALSFILDAEVVGIDRKNGCKLLSFQELSARDRGSKFSSVTLDSIKVEVCTFVFDIMFVNGQQLLGCPLRRRREYLKDQFKGQKSGYFEYAKEITIEAEDASMENEGVLTKINTFLEDAFQSSCEGIMVKSLDVDAGYCPSKRTDSWLKVKRDYVEGLNDSLDLVPIGAWHGNGRKAGWYSPYLMACYNPDTEEFESVCRVMSGFTDSFYKEMKEFFSGDRILSKKAPYYRTAETPDMWFSPELVWQIRGADFTVSPVHHAAIGLVHASRGISIRFPRFIRSVADRRPEDCSTAADIADMFHSQTRKMDVGIAK